MQKKENKHTVKHELQTFKYRLTADKKSILPWHEILLSSQLLLMPIRYQRTVHNDKAWDSQFFLDWETPVDFDSVSSIEPKDAREGNANL